MLHFEVWKHGHQDKAGLLSVTYGSENKLEAATTFIYVSFDCSQLLPKVDEGCLELSVAVCNGYWD